MIYLVYKTDSHHSNNSRDIIGIATTKNIAIKLCKQQAKKEGDTLSDADIFNLDTMYQTQGYEGDGEFQFEQMEKNTLL